MRTHAAQIALDLQRTFPNHVDFRVEGKGERVQAGALAARPPGASTRARRGEGGALRFEPLTQSLEEPAELKASAWFANVRQQRAAM
jgi:hypothetical protein